MSFNSLIFLSKYSTSCLIDFTYVNMHPNSIKKYLDLRQVTTSLNKDIFHSLDKTMVRKHTYREYKQGHLVGFPCSPSLILGE